MNTNDDLTAEIKTAHNQAIADLQDVIKAMAEISAFWKMERFRLATNSLWFKIYRGGIR